MRGPRERIAAPYADARFAHPILSPSTTPQAFANLPVPASHRSPAVAGAPDALVGVQWPGGSPRKCVDWRGGRHFHWACLRRMADAAAMDLDVRLHEAATRQHAFARVRMTPHTSVPCR